jgi:hypothetical protein
MTLFFVILFIAFTAALIEGVASSGIGAAK